jgi:hypothetical protein
LEDQAFLQEYSLRLEKFLQFVGEPLIERFSSISDLLGAKATGQEATRRAVRIIDSWQGLVRDLLLAYYGHLDLVQHEFMIDRIKDMSLQVVPERLVAWLGRFNEAKNFLGRNVNPKNVLEQLATAI